MSNPALLIRVAGYAIALALGYAMGYCMGRQSKGGHSREFPSESVYAPEEMDADVHPVSQPRWDSGQDACLADEIVPEVNGNTNKQIKKLGLISALWTVVVEILPSIVRFIRDRLCDWFSGFGE